MFKRWKNSELFKQIFRFCIVGGWATLIDYVILVICKELIGLSVLLSSAISFTISVIFNYLASIKWVFNVQDKKSNKNCRKKQK